MTCVRTLQRDLSLRQPQNKNSTNETAPCIINQAILGCHEKKKHTHKHSLSQTHTFIFTDSYDVLKTSCDSRRWKKPFRSRLNQPQNIKSKKSTQNAPQTAEQWGRRWGEECDLAGLFWNLILEKKERKKKKPLLHPSTHSPLQQCGTPS